MELRSLLLAIGAMAVIFLLVPMATAQTTETIWIYGHVRVGNNLTDNIQVILTGPVTGNPTTYTSMNGTDHGYYQFLIDNGSSGDYIVYASYYNTTYSGSIHVTGAVGHLSDIIIPATAPTPTPTATPTPTPRPSDDIGGVVRRNNDSSFVPLSATKISPTPLPRYSPTPAPTAAQNATATPTPVPVVGTFSNMYIWLVIALVAILSILAIAVAAFLYFKAK